MNLRAIAARVITAVMKGNSLTEALATVLPEIKMDRDQALLRAIVYGVCRQHDYLRACLKILLTKPLKEKDSDIEHLLWVGLYQLKEMRIPPHAAVAETVNAVHDLKKIWAKQLVNAVLRQFIRQRETLDHEVNQLETVHYHHPHWIIEKVKKDYPHDWQAILIANNEHPPFSLRVNQRHCSREEYLSQLPKQISAKKIEYTTSGITLTEAMDVSVLPGFQQGDISVQDGAAQLAAELLNVSPSLRVLDACAAPGGKTAHLLELEPSLSLLAIDIDANRLTRVQDNLSRLGLQASCVTADIGNRLTWWDGQLFDRILLDAPCSASGVIRRHPDIKLLRRPTDIDTLAMTQLRLLKEIWKTLAPGGLLLYATCSVFKQENSDVVSQFLAMFPDATEEVITADWGRSCQVGLQVLPGMNGMDGFYYARLRKQSVG